MDTHQAQLYGLNRLGGTVHAEAISLSSRLVLAPEMRRTRAVGRLLDAPYEDARADGIWLDFLHCRPQLVSHYEGLGHRRFAPPLPLDIVAKIDLIEGEGGAVTPVDTKKGKRPHGPPRPPPGRTLAALRSSSLL
jgi:hypothetical protein